MIFSRILDYVTLTAFTSIGCSSNDVRHQVANPSKVNEAVNAEFTDVKSHNLSETLEKLYVWEKKLYKEVKVNSLWFLVRKCFMFIVASL